MRLTYELCFYKGLINEGILSCWIILALCEFCFILGLSQRVALCKAVVVLRGIELSSCRPLITHKLLNTLGRKHSALIGWRLHVGVIRVADWVSGTRAYMSSYYLSSLEINI